LDSDGRDGEWVDLLEYSSAPGSCCHTLRPSPDPGWNARIDILSCPGVCNLGGEWAQFGGAAILYHCGKQCWRSSCCARNGW
jgi:hypothetical protein